MPRALVILVIVAIAGINFFDLFHFQSLDQYNPFNYGKIYLSSSNNQNTQTDIATAESDECDWVYVEPRTYFRRQSSFYFWDVSLVTLSYITMSQLGGRRFDIEVSVRKAGVEVHKQNITETQTISVKTDPFDRTFVYLKLLFRFDFINQKSDKQTDLNDISINITRN